METEQEIKISIKKTERTEPKCIYYTLKELYGIF